MFANHLAVVFAEQRRPELAPALGVAALGRVFDDGPPPEPGMFDLGDGAPALDRRAAPRRPELVSEPPA